jgi:hypothetical protein
MGDDRIGSAMQGASMLRAYYTLALILGLAVCAPALGVPGVYRLEVRIATGTEGAPAGAHVELRLREAGRAEQRFPLAGDAPWPAGSTRTVPIALNEPLDPDAVARFSIYYRGPAGAPASWEIASAEVFALSAEGHEWPLGPAIRGVIRREGEISSAERAASSLMCVTDADCDDGRACNGRERCEPGARNANARGCVAGVPVACPTNQVCMERLGCRGMEGSDMAKAPGAGAPAASVPASGRDSGGGTGLATGAALQTCSGRDVLLSEASGATRTAPCPPGTACVAQPNGTGICAPGRAP